MGTARRRASILALGLLAAALPAAADAPGRVVLVLDASGSMWGEVDDRAKIEVAREVVRDLVAEWDDGLEVGLTVYGHRERRDCHDIEPLVPVGPADPDALLAAVDSVRPRGMTPIGASLRLAAEQLAHRQQTATVVLVSDGNETCGLDPCAIARELEESGVDFTAHVVGFDLNTEDSRELQCLADETGGLFLSADDTASLRAALRAAMLDVARAASGLWVAAALATDRAPIQEPVHWTIYPAGDQAGAAPLMQLHQPTLSPELQPGRYRFRAEYAGLSGEAEIDVDPRKRSRHIVGLDAGRLEVTGVSRQSNQSPGRALRWMVHDDRGRLLAEASGSRHAFVLPADAYRVTALHGDSEVAREIVLKPGQTLRERFVLGRGRLALRAILSRGGRPIEEPLHWTVRPEDASPPAKLLVDERAPTGLYALESGRYRVSATLGETTVHDTVDVKSGVTRTHTVELSAGIVRAFASLPPPGGPILEPVQWTLHRADGPADAIARVEDASHLFVLPDGEYRLTARRKGMSGSAEVVVRPGEKTSVNVTLR